MNHNIVTSETELRDQHSLVHDLNIAYALVNVTRVALSSPDLDDTDASARVLLQVENTLFDLGERQQEKAKAMEAALDGEAPTFDPQSAHESLQSAAASVKARLVATAVDNLQCQFDGLWSAYTSTGIDQASLALLGEIIGQLYDLHHEGKGGAE